MIREEIVRVAAYQAAAHASFEGRKQQIQSVLKEAEKAARISFAFQKAF